MKRELPDELKFLSNRKAIQKTSSASMAGKLCLVTGATSGIGLETARRFAKGGADLLLVARDRAKALRVSEELSIAGGAVDFVIADFEDLDELRAAADEILSRFPRIDVLVHSAGLHSTTLRRTKTGRESVFAVNHLASFLLTSLLLGRLCESAPARVIYVNSEGHRFGGLDLDDPDWEHRHYTGLRGYGASKTAQLLAMREFSRRLEGRGVTINALHPGDVRTGIGRNNGPLYRLFLHTIVWPFLREVSISGEAIYWLASAPELAGTSGRYYHLTIEERPADHALDDEAAARCWELSRRLCGLEA
ncbi:MAG TPA: SDR family NAD(P)-dependent oxidoreductase [Rectinemataceae bacterium]|nr:SDR family NAD(P)-dependent oxidoreductase [Rectinemataceae bacterium]